MDIETLIGILILVFWVFGLGRGKRKKKAPLPAPSPDQAHDSDAVQPGSFEEALRQIREALGDIDESGKEAPAQRHEPEFNVDMEPVSRQRSALESGPATASGQRRQAHPPAPDSKRTPDEWTVPERAVYDQSFETRPAFRGDRFKPAERRSTNRVVGPRKTAPSPLPLIGDTHKRESDTRSVSERRMRTFPDARKLQEAIKWREILGPPRSLSPRRPGGRERH